MIKEGRYHFAITFLTRVVEGAFITPTAGVSIGTMMEEVGGDRGVALEASCEGGGGGEGGQR